MGAEDFADALDSLLRLPLADTQDREVPRVLLECCLQERAYNPYYETLASKLCERMPKRHRLTLQLCVWDQIREMAPESDAAREHAAEEHAESAKMSVRRVANLARFAAGCLVSGAVAPAALRVVNFGGEDASPRAKLFRRLLLQAILSAPPSKRGAMHAIFQTVAEKGLGRGGEMGALRASLANALGARGTLEGLGKGARTPSAPRRTSRNARKRRGIYSRGRWREKRSDRSRSIERAEREPRGAQSIAATAPTSLTMRAIFQNVTRNGIPAFSKKY